MSRFKAAMLEVHDLNHSIVMLALKKRLKANGFYFFLSKRFLHNFSKLLIHVDKYIDNEERMVEKQKDKIEQKRAREDQPAPWSKKQKHDGMPPRRSQSPQHFKDFTPLNAPWRQILMKIKN